MPLSDNLLANYPCDEASGNLLDVLSANDLTAVNAPTATTGKISGARVCVSASSRYFNTSTVLCTSYPFSWLGWFRFNALGVNQNLMVQGVAGQNDFAFGLACTAGSKLNLYASDAGSSFDQVAGSTTINTGVWYFIAAIWRSATDRQVYLNTASEIVASTSRPLSASQNVFSVGSYAPVGADVLDADVDEISLFARDATSDLSAFYNGGAGLAYPFGGGVAAGNTIRTGRPGGNVNYENATFVGGNLSF